MAYVKVVVPCRPPGRLDPHQIVCLIVSKSLIHTWQLQLHCR